MKTANHRKEDQVRITAKGGGSDVVGVERTGGLAIGRRSGEGICLRQEGRVIAYVELSEIRCNQSRFRVIAPPDIEIGRSLPLS